MLSLYYLYVSNRSTKIALMKFTFIMSVHLVSIDVTESINIAEHVTQ